MCSELKTKQVIEAKNVAPRCSIFDLQFLSPLNTAFDTRPALDMRTLL
jgi:hypothetical protein